MIAEKNIQERSGSYIKAFLKSIPLIKHKKTAMRNGLPYLTVRF